jgi:two-component system, NarL family, nitrate/nitrite response regulator NarL
MNILVVDDHEIVGTLLANMIRQFASETSVLLATSLEEGMRLVDFHHPGSFSLAVVDLVIKGESEGPSTITVFREAFPSIPVLAISALDGNEIAPLVYAKGARGYLPKHCTPDEFLLAIQKILNGELYIHRDFENVIGNPIANRRPLINERQLQILELLGQGLSDKGVAIKLGITDDTVAYHLQNVFRALEVSTRAQAVAQAFRLGLLTVSRTV